MTALPLPRGATSPPSALFPPGLDVLAQCGYQLLEGRPRPAFGDDRWSLAAIRDWPKFKDGIDQTIDFAAIHNPVWRTVAKEFALCLLQPQYGIEWQLERARREPLGPHVLANHVRALTRFFNFLSDPPEEAGRGPVLSLARLAQAHCDAHLATLTNMNWRLTFVAVARLLLDYQPALPSVDAVPTNFRPWGRESASAVCGQVWNVGETLTEEIPRELFGAIVGAALNVVNVIGPDLLGAADESRRLKEPRYKDECQRPENWPGGVIPAFRRGENAGSAYGEHAVARLLEELRATGEPLPAVMWSKAGESWHGVNLSLLAARAGGYTAGIFENNPERWAQVLAVKDEFGVGGGGLSTPISHVTSDVTGAAGPWRTSSLGPQELEPLLGVVHTACLIIVAAVSGMRASEMAELTDDSLFEEEIAPGISRYRVRSILIKGQPLGGRRETWTVIEEVKAALDLAARVQHVHGARGLFRTASFAGRYDRFAAFWNDICARVDGLVPVPTRAEWPLSLRQFRKTLARELGWRENGVIAGKLHLKHVSIATTEGYQGSFGSSVQEFRRLVQKHREDFTAQLSVETYRAWEAGEPMSGPGAKPQARIFARVQAELQAILGPLPGAVRQRDEDVHAALRRHAGQLYVAPLNLCWYRDPSLARCQMNRPDATPQELSVPRTPRCEPTLCGQATVHPANAPVWIGKERHLTVLIEDPSLPGGERPRLEQELQRVRRVTEPLSRGEAVHPPSPGGGR